LVVHGTDDTDVAFYDGVYAYEHAPGAERFWIEEGSHLGFWLNPAPHRRKKPPGRSSIATWPITEHRLGTGGDHPNPIGVHRVIVTALEGPTDRSPTKENSPPESAPAEEMEHFASPASPSATGFSPAVSGHGPGSR
jgi:hypothetical protein